MVMPRLLMMSHPVHRIRSTCSSPIRAPPTQPQQHQRCKRKSINRVEIEMEIQQLQAEMVQLPRRLPHRLLTWTLRPAPVLKRNSIIVAVMSIDNDCIPASWILLATTAATMAGIFVCVMQQLNPQLDGRRAPTAIWSPAIRIIRISVLVAIHLVVQCYHFRHQMSALGAPILHPALQLLTPPAAGTTMVGKSVAFL